MEIENKLKSQFVKAHSQNEMKNISWLIQSIPCGYFLQDLIASYTTSLGTDGHVYFEKNYLQNINFN